MSDYEMMDKEEIYSKVLRAGRRTYFFDVRATKAGDYYLTITESKKFTNDDGSYHYKKHKIYLYKEDFTEFRDILAEMTDYIIEEKGEEVISERHQKDYKRENDFASQEGKTPEDTSKGPESFTDISFDDI
ncbi:PUR family DNA/RNA-binding protein [Winogradskyella sp. DF17]|uniref:PUR family DNA/RNA-binding protein n=1 Tax=Winogradskyella pelagia TaxID=2819984 RepID=A0ABS3T2C9_9FLAO|nr:PUR family DNA/RNA-binding protein [Winogradskyella sp. DF17]MBO3116599.1 PUR family DNA/RNA-binding protein [Winogradskyella sp. DF17]